LQRWEQAGPASSEVRTGEGFEGK